MQAQSKPFERMSAVEKADVRKYKARFEAVYKRIRARYPADDPELLQWEREYQSFLEAFGLT
jgi:hypothetical protein